VPRFANPLSTWRLLDQVDGASHRRSRIATARNVAGITGLGLLRAAALGGGLSWTGPTAYLVPCVYTLYTQ
jgi:hypothetical protein